MKKISFFALLIVLIAGISIQSHQPLIPAPDPKAKPKPPPPPPPQNINQTSFLLFMG